MRHGNFEIYTVSPNGVALTRVTDHPKPDIAGADYVGQPTWSRDGKKIAYNYHHLVGEVGSEIRVLDLTTQQTTTFTTVPPSSDYPAWSR